MKRKKVIRIKNPCLQKIRYNLRMLIIKAVEEKNSCLRDLDRFYESKGDKEKARKTNKEVQKNSSDLGRSICVCVVCGTAKKDMVYVPEHQSWFCIDCAKMNRISIP